MNPAKEVKVITLETGDLWEDGGADKEALRRQLDAELQDGWILTCHVPVVIRNDGTLSRVAGVFYRDVIEAPSAVLDSRWQPLKVVKFPPCSENTKAALSALLAQEPFHLNSACKHAAALRWLKDVFPSAATLVEAVRLCKSEESAPDILRDYIASFEALHGHQVLVVEQALKSVNAEELRLWAA